MENNFTMIRIFLKNIFFLTLLITFFYFIQKPTNCYAQKTKIMGTVIDAKTKETLPFVSVALKGSKVGTVTDYEGKYKIETSAYSDSLIFTCLGYKRVAKKIIRNKFQVIDIKLESSSLQLSQIDIKANKKDKNPALTIFDKIIDHKSENNINKLDAYQYETYNKIQFDANNISKKLSGKRIKKKYNFIYNYVDTSTINGKPYLPILLIESLSDYYFRKSPKAEREYIKASQISGVENESVQQFLGKMYFKVNIYDNYIDMFGKGFVSPIANTGKLFYHYFLVDSAFIDNNWCYNLVFQPKIKQENVFNGNFWVADTTFAIKKIELKIDSKVNIDFINNVDISQEFINVENKIWMVKKEIIVANFNVLGDSTKTIGVFGRRTSYFKDFIINTPKEDDFYSTTTNVIVAEDARNKDDKYWESVRHEDLTPKEKGIYKMVDTIKSLPIFKTWYDIVTTVVTYYYVWGHVELGPYFSTYSFNDIEGNRFRLGARTSNKFSTKYMLEAYTAYGTKDEKFKYGGSFLYLFNPNPRRCAAIEYKNDMEQLGQSINAFREDNILSSVLRRSSSNKLSMAEQVKAYYEHEWFQGFSNSISIMHREMFPAGLTNFLIYDNAGGYKIYNTISTSDISLKTRFAFNEKFVMGKFERISLGTKYPIIQLYYTYGLENVWNSKFSYHKLELNYRHWFNIYPFGYSEYTIDAGKIWGELPYPLLKLHEGNETYFFDQYSFNMMNYYEFVSDQYISVYYSHFFDGFFLNKIPLLRRLKWREVVWGKGAIGTLEDKNKAMMPFPSTLYALNQPYFEVGAGIENIFKLLRIDAIWRLSHLDHPNVSEFGIRASLQIKF